MIIPNTSHNISIWVPPKDKTISELRILHPSMSGSPSRLL